jgi:hypothetical protein
MFSEKLFCYNKIGGHPCEDLTKFDDKPNMKYKFLTIFLCFGLHI